MESDTTKYHLERLIAQRRAELARAALAAQEKEEAERQRREADTLDAEARELQEKSTASRMRETAAKVIDFLDVSKTEDISGYRGWILKSPYRESSAEREFDPRWYSNYDQPAEVVGLKYSLSGGVYLCTDGSLHDYTKDVGEGTLSSHSRNYVGGLATDSTILNAARYWIQANNAAYKTAHHPYETSYFMNSYELTTQRQPSQLPSNFHISGYDTSKLSLMDESLEGVVKVWEEHLIRLPLKPA